MKKHQLFFGYFALLIVLLPPLNAQNSYQFWSPVNSTRALSIQSDIRKVDPIKESFFELNIESLKAHLANVGNRENQGNTTVQFPNSDGNMVTYQVFEASVLVPEFQALHPEIRSYAGKAIDNPSQTIRFSITPKGFHAMVLGSSNGTQYIDPYSLQNNLYTVFSRKDLRARNFQWECGVIDSPMLNRVPEHNHLAKNVQDGILRDYRIAIACTGEYGSFHGTTVPEVVAAMAVTMTRVNGIYERDLSITMSLVDNTSIIFLDGTTDPFNNNNAGTLINQSQSVINATIGAGNYDIGHTFSTGGGGLAGLGVTCNNSQKARGITGLASPEGDVFDVDYVAHELGHQFGAPHTFNGDGGANCQNQRSSSDAYEPGSGSTIMGYAGICPPQNVQNNSDAYFHQISLVRINSHIQSTGGCPVNSINTGNTEPTANAGNNFVIPRSTPYRLSGSSTDPDGTASHTYTWEQFDLGPQGLGSETTVLGPIVRSFEGTTNPTRYVPRLQDLLVSQSSSAWEKLSSVSRTLNYRLTVRDNDPVGGQTDFDQMTATVNAAAGPFIVTSQNSVGISWDVGSTQTITWNVAGTTSNGINEANVNILLSTDGINYDTVLANNVPNDGSHDIIVPDVSSLDCRIMVEAANGIFFNINSQNIAIGAVISCNNTYDSGPVNAAIPDGLGNIITPNPGPPLFSTINVPDSFTIESLSLSLDISHNSTGQLLVQLQHPDIGTNNIFVNAYNGECGTNDDLIVTFEDGAPSINCGNPTTGTFAPSNSFVPFEGLDAQGVWAIAVVDFFSGTTGTLNSWSLDFCTIDNLSVDESSLNDDLNVYPNPNNGEFTVSFSPRSGEDITIDIFDIRGRKVLSRNFKGSANFSETINIGNVQSGMYLLNIADGDQKVIKKLIIE